MAKQVILAVAGAGKTYHICHTINPSKRNLILAFTHENINNIRKELHDAYGCIPRSTTVTTFDSFVYHDCILPYEPSIAEYFDIHRFRSCGISMMDPPKQCIIRRGKKIPNPKYKKKNCIEHYLNSEKQYYCATLSELVLQVSSRHLNLLKKVAARLNLFFDCVLIDEFQDFREYNYDLIMALGKSLQNVILVGDYYQHSVLASNNSGKPYKKRKGELSYEQFIKELNCAGFEVDLTTLNKSRRCSVDVCQYVRNKLGIEISSLGTNTGNVIWVDKNAKEILENQHIVKLVYRDSSKYSFNAINWSYSKGDTLDAVCVILTDKFERLADDKFSTKKISTSTINKLYVAMTRSRGNLYLMRASTFKKIRDSYVKAVNIS